MKNKTCFSYWFPKLEGSEIPVPPTKIVAKKFDYFPVMECMYESKPVDDKLDGLIEKIQKAGNLLGWPCFLRTGQTSGKHEWEKTCYLGKRDHIYIKKHIMAIMEFSFLADLMGLDCSVWVVRKLLKTEPIFHAFWGKMPITLERRYFIKDGKVVCHHPYWPKDAFEAELDREKEFMIDGMNVEPENEVKKLTEISEKVGIIFPEYWSVDWLFTDEGWVLTDMAEGEKSYHWPECKMIVAI